MPTIDTTVKQSSMIMDVATKFFGSNYDAYKKSLLVEQPLETNGDFVNYNFGNLTDTLEDYREEKESFDDELEDKVSSLKKSSDDVKNLGKDEAVAAENREAAQVAKKNEPAGALSRIAEFLTAEGPPPPVKTPDEIESTEEDMPEDLRQNYSKVQTLVRDYNSTVSYLNENRGVSGNVATLADSFGDNGDLEDSLKTIGISSDSSGGLSITASTLKKALTEKPKDVDDALGAEGLAGKLDKQIDRVNFQRDKLFPNIAKFVGSDVSDSAEGLYSVRTATATHYRRPEGTLFNMFA